MPGLVILGMVLVTWLAIWLQQRGNAQDGGRTSAAIGDGMGNFLDVFDPGQARAMRDLKAQQNQGPVAPTPDPDPDDPLQLEIGPGGVPKKVRIRRPEQH